MIKKSPVKFPAKIPREKLTLLPAGQTGASVPETPNKNQL